MSPQILVKGQRMPLVSPAFEGVRYLAHNGHSPTIVTQLLNSRMAELMRLLRSKSSRLALSPSQPGTINDHLSRFDEYYESNNDLPDEFRRPLSLYRNILAQFSAVPRHPRTPSLTLLESQLNAYALEQLHSAQRDYTVTPEDVELLAAAQNRAGIFDYDLKRKPDVAVLNTSPGAHLLYDKALFSRRGVFAGRARPLAQVPSEPHLLAA